MNTLFFRFFMGGGGFWPFRGNTKSLLFLCFSKAQSIPRAEEMTMITTAYISLFSAHFHNFLSYAAPEVLLRKGHGKPVDMWSIGLVELQEFSSEATVQERKTCKSNSFNAIFSFSESSRTLCRFSDVKRTTYLRKQRQSAC